MGFFGNEPDSYKVHNTLSITVGTEPQMIQVASISDKEKNVRYVSSKSEIEDQSQIRSDLINKALEKINNKVLIFEKNLKVKLTPESFEDVSFSIIKPEQIPRMQKSKLSSYSSHRGIAADFGQTAFSVTLRVTYQVSEK